MQHTTYYFVTLGQSKSYASALPLYRTLNPNEVMNGDKIVVYTNGNTVVWCKLCPNKHKYAYLCNRFVWSHDTILPAGN
jgi:hypothetical protein